MKKILLAFSGGIDSCAAVEILRADGWSVELLVIDMSGDKAILEQAQQSAQRVDATLHTLDARDLFKREIIDNFVSEYQSGRTPAPCTRCNPAIKWRLLAERADQLGIHHIATGHYFQVAKHRGKHFVSRGVDPSKDQSYYLWGVSSDILARAITPMGSYIKAEIKERSHIKRESMGICFLRGDHYSKFLATQCGELRGGDIIDNRGDVVAQHNGIARYTIGQRRGDGIPDGMRVVEILAPQNQLRVGLNEELYSDTIRIGECHFIDIDEITTSQRITVMIRGIGRNPDGYARLTLTDFGAEIKLLDDRAWAVAPGQPVVLYIDDRVVGGGYLL